MTKPKSLEERRDELAEHLDKVHPILPVLNFKHSDAFKSGWENCQAEHAEILDEVEKALKEIGHTIDSSPEDKDGGPCRFHIAASRNIKISIAKTALSLRHNYYLFININLHGNKMTKINMEYGG